MVGEQYLHDHGWGKVPKVPTRSMSRSSTVVISRNRPSRATASPAPLRGVALHAFYLALEIEQGDRHPVAVEAFDQKYCHSVERRLPSCCPRWRSLGRADRRVGHHQALHECRVLKTHKMLDPSHEDPRLAIDAAGNEAATDSAK